MKKKNDDNLFKNVYPNFRYVMAAGRNTYIKYKNTRAKSYKKKKSSETIPDCYGVCNTNTIDSEVVLNTIEGTMPSDINGNMYICQCLGTKEAFMVGDTNLVKIKFSKDKVELKNKMMWSPVSLAKVGLQKTKHRFDHMGLMFMSPGLGMFSYMEGMYLLPDGRLGITSDVDRPWIVDRENLQITSPLGKREEWLPMMGGEALDVMGRLFAGYSNSHVIYTDVVTNELFLVNYQVEQKDGSSPCVLMKWNGNENIEKWSVVDELGKDIKIKQSIHELIFTKDYILLADTAFATGDEILSPWKNSPLPNTKTIVYIVDRREMNSENTKVVAKKIEIDEACIHLIAEYENPNEAITVYMLHTPATNTAEIIRSYDVDLEGNRFPEHLVGYGTLPVLDISSLGKHVIDMSKQEVLKSSYIRDQRYTFAPYMYSYMGRQTRNFDEQDLFIMFKGHRQDMLPKRVYEAYKEVKNRKIPLDDLTKNGKISCNNSIARMNKERFEVEDLYEFEDKVLLYTISCIESDDRIGKGYVLAGVVRDVEENDQTSGHEYWMFDANALAKGPICKLGHKELNNSVLFHTVYLSNRQEEELEQREVKYNVDLREDYPKEELVKWNKEVLEVFENVIWPYFEKDKEKTRDIIEEYTKKRIDEQIGYEHLLGEQKIENPQEFAEKMFEETKRMLKTTGWKEEVKKNGVLVESKKISGVYKEAGVFVTRAFGELDINADEFFEYMTSPKGYAVIDPVSDPNDHSKEPIEVYSWNKGSRLEAAITTTNIPMLEPCDFVVLNAIDPKERLFASKSIIHEAFPGASKYISNMKSENGHERAINTFSIKVEPINEKKCRVLCINYADMVGKTSNKINNFINCKVFFTSLYKRMQKAVSEIN